jgi:DNA polymerase-3 subunit gamma/tau
MIARSAQGSFRDALGTLDQLVAFGGEEVGLDEVLQMLGAADAELLFEAVDAVAAEDPKGVLLGVENMARSGRDPAQFARDLLAHLRHLLVVQTTGEVPSSFVVTATDSERLRAQASTVGAATLVRTIEELAAALTAVREGDDARMAVEIALLKAARPDLDPTPEGLLRRIERLEKQLTGEAQPAGPVAAPSPAPAPPAGDASPDDLAPAEDEAQPDEGRDAVDFEEIVRVWPSVLEKLGEKAPALAATFEGARPVGMDDEGLKIGFPADKTFNKKKAESPERREAVVAAFQEVTGERLRPTYVVLEGETSSEGDAPEPKASGREGLDEAELLERLKSEFDAEEVS